MKLSGKVVIITGAGRGIGRALALGFAREGARLALVSRGADALLETEKEIAQHASEFLAVVADVSRAMETRMAVAKIVERFRGIHVLINNAGLLGPHVPVLEYPVKAWDEVMTVNVRGAFLWSKAVLPIMIQQRCGNIINVSSGAGKIGKPNWGAYAASKFAVEGFSQVLAAEVRSFGINVNAVNPGAIRTRMRAKAYPDEDPMTLPEPDEIIPVFLKLAALDPFGMTGASIEALHWIPQEKHS